MSYAEMGAKVGLLVEEKQAAYGDSFGRSGDVLRLLYPDGIAPQQYDDLLCVARIIDKLFRIATDRDALGESPYLDIAGYGLLGAARSPRPTMAEHQCTKSSGCQHPQEVWCPEATRRVEALR